MTVLGGRALGSDRHDARRRIEAALAELRAAHPEYDLRPGWEEGGDGALTVLLDEWGRATVGTSERGILRDPHAAADMDDLLYQAMLRPTHDKAVSDEVRTRRDHPNADPWERTHALHAERLGRIRPHWAERRRRERMW